MKIAMACFVGLLSIVGASAEPVLEGRVRLASGGPAVGAQVLVFDLADLSRYVGATTDESGQFVLSLGALGSGQALPEGFGLGQNYPNPFNPGTVIPYELAAEGYVRLEVFNLLGQRVATLVDGEQAAGLYTAEWDARDAAGQGVAAGVYVYRLTAGGGVATRRMTLVDGPGFDRISPLGAAETLVEDLSVADATRYGLTVSGIGLETYVDAAFVVGSGSVEVVVEAADPIGRGKAVQGGVLGDVNNDGRVNISDALIVATYSVNSGITVPNNGDIQLGDVNGDGRINISDALIVATYSIDPTNSALPAGIGQLEAVEIPDMVVDMLTVLPAAIEADTPVTVQVRVANEGTALAISALVVLRVNGQVMESFPLTLNTKEETGIQFDPLVLGAGSHLIEVEVDPDGALTTEAVRDNNQAEQTVTVAAPPLGLAVRSVVFILDLSGSMDADVEGGGSRLDAAKAALAQVLARAPTDGSQEYALTTFSGCGGVRVPIEFTGDPQAVVSYSSGLVANGGTPLAEALRRGQHLGMDEASSDDVLLVLLSDGEESCSGDPVAVAQSIGQGVRAKAVASAGVLAKVIKVNAIGFGVEPGSAADQQIQAIAKEAGGNYFRASETADLAAALGQASRLVQTRVPTLAGQVMDAAGKPIQGALVQLRNMQENTDANGRYLFPNNAGVQGVDSLIITAEGYARFEAEVYLFDVDKEFDVRLTPGGGGGRYVGEERVFSLPGGGEMAMVWIEPGVFQMGSPESEEGRESDEGPVHEVEISTGFWLGKYEVTVGQFRRFVDATGYDAGDGCWTYENDDGDWRSGRNWSNPGYAPPDDHPVVCVSWEDVSAYAGWLSSETGVLHRLPTEAEWEYACRAGTTTRWSFGDEESQLGDYAWYHDNAWGVGKTHAQAVGGKLPNAWGLHDMHGNVWEWVHDWFDSDYYKSSPRVDPPGPSSGSDRVSRGGSFSFYSQNVRSADRVRISPGLRIYYVGVRLLRLYNP